MSDDLLQLGERITLAPVIHGSGDMAVEIRRLLLARKFDCIAVPLPPSFQPAVEQALDALPGVTAVLQEETRVWRTEWSEDADEPDEPETPRAFSYVPLDPCQPVIAALRFACQERIPRAFIDLETARWEPRGMVLPDPYALKQLQLDKFAGAILPLIPRPADPQTQARVRHMGARLRQLEHKYRSILCLCALPEWPWIREAYTERLPVETADDEVTEPEIYSVAPQTLTFLLGELPFITDLYERARSELDDDENLSVDGVKELLLTTRTRYQDDLKSLARKITPHLLATYLRYVRNLCLIDRRMTPDLYTLVVAAQQIAGDQFALHLVETARTYSPPAPPQYPPLHLGIDKGRLPDGDVVQLKTRLPGPPVSWRSCQLKPKPDRRDLDRWKKEMRWNPHAQISWPPEDLAIESFRGHVKDVALAIIGSDLIRSEKFTSSLKDGLDIRETLRNWHTGDLYVKLIPPTRGKLDCVVMLFDSPADPRDYPWRITWVAEPHDESTLALFATDFRQQTVGPGIGLATYGGAVFLFPPRPIRDVWSDRRLDFTDTLEERLVAAGCLNSREKHIAILSQHPPGPAWRRMAKQFRKKLVHVPLSKFSQALIQQLRLVHVLNGRHVRSYAADFIRKM